MRIAGGIIAVVAGLLGSCSATLVLVAPSLSELVDTTAERVFTSFGPGREFQDALDDAGIVGEPPMEMRVDAQESSSGAELNDLKERKSAWIGAVLSLGSIVLGVLVIQSRDWVLGALLIAYSVVGILICGGFVTLMMCTALLGGVLALFPLRNESTNVANR